jgi:hypothetical protein
VAKNAEFFCVLLFLKNCFFFPKKSLFKKLIFFFKVVWFLNSKGFYMSWGVIVLVGRVSKISFGFFLKLFSENLFMVNFPINHFF